MATGILPREFAFKQRGQIPVAIVRFLLRKKKHTHTHTPSFDSPWCGLGVLLPLFIPHR